MPELISRADDQAQFKRSTAKRHRIAVFLNGIGHYYQHTICEGIAKKAAELKFTVLFFTSNISYTVNENNEGELKIFTLPDMRDFDSIIILTNTIISEQAVEYLKKALPANSIPIVSIGPHIDSCYRIDSVDDGSMETLIRHFITDHGFTRINYISGPPGNHDAKYRLNVYTKVLERYQIKFEDSRVYVGDFNRECAREAVAQFLQHDIPQAIVCANDNMALGAYAELIRRGFNVPDDIALSGYDCTHEAERHVPRITTVKQPMLEMGIRAVQIINNVISGVHVEKEYEFNSQVVIAGSCGCEDAEQISERRFIKELVLKTDEFRTHDNISTSMMELLTGTYTMQDVVNQLKSLAHVLAFRFLYFCVNESSLINHMQISNTYPGEMTLVLGIADDIMRTGLKFKTKNILPELSNGPAALVLAPLYYKNNTFGYIAFDFNNSSGSMQRIWVKNLRLALENLRTQEVLKQYSISMEKISLHDPLTGVLNRRGLEKRVQPLLKTPAHDMLFVIFVDLDGLKRINDTYGHAAGDEAIQVVADILRHCSRPDDIIARMGGDEFVCVGLVPNEETLRSILFSMQSYGTLYNERSSKRYTVNASYGWCLGQCNEKLSIMQMIDKADRNLYEQKRLRSQQ